MTVTEDLKIQVERLENTQVLTKKKIDSINKELESKTNQINSAINSLKKYGFSSVGLNEVGYVMSKFYEQANRKPDIKYACATDTKNLSFEPTLLVSVSINSYPSPRGFDKYGGDIVVMVRTKTSARFYGLPNNGELYGENIEYNKKKLTPYVNSTDISYILIFSMYFGV